MKLGFWPGGASRWEPFVTADVTSADVTSCALLNECYIITILKKLQPKINIYQLQEEYQSIAFLILYTSHVLTRKGMCVGGYKDIIMPLQHIRRILIEKYHEIVFRGFRFFH